MSVLTDPLVSRLRAFKRIGKPAYCGWVQHHCSTWSMVGGGETPQDAQDAISRYVAEEGGPEVADVVETRILPAGEEPDQYESEFDDL